MIWDEKAVETLRRLHKAGKKYPEIAAVLGTTREAVSGKVHRLKLPPRPHLGEHRPRNLRAKPDVPVATLREAVRAVETPPAPPPPPAARTCCWPIGEPRRPGFRFCEAVPVIEGTPYCLAHCKIAYIKWVA